MQYYSCITEKKAFYLLGHSLSALAQNYFTLRCPSCPVNFCSAAQGSPGGPCGPAGAACRLRSDEQPAVILILFKNLYIRMLASQCLYNFIIVLL